MVDVWIRQRNQLTVPVDIARQAGLAPGSLCRMEFANGVITIVPADGAAGSDLESYVGIARGAWGGTPKEMDATIAADRDTWDR